MLSNFAELPEDTTPSSHPRSVILPIRFASFLRTRSPTRQLLNCVPGMPECRNAGMPQECHRNATGMPQEGHRKATRNAPGMRQECARNAPGMRNPGMRNRFVRASPCPDTTVLIPRAKPSSLPTAWPHLPAVRTHGHDGSAPASAPLSYGIRGHRHDHARPTGYLPAA